MTDNIIYFVETMGAEKRCGVFKERRTAESWTHSLGDTVQNTVTPVHLWDSRFNYNLNGDFNSTLFKVVW